MLYDGLKMIDGADFKNLTVDSGTEAERLALTSPSAGEIFYQTDGTIGKYVHNGSKWEFPGPDTSKTAGSLATINSYNGNGFLTNDGRLMVWGDSPQCDLGLGNTVSFLTPQEVVLPSDESGTIVDAMLIGQQGYAISSTGNLYSWGFGGFGNLGHGDTVNKHIPTKVSTFNGTVSEFVKPKINGYATDQRITIVKLTNGEYWACGYNGFGGLGTGNTTQQNSFFQIVSPDPGSSPITNVWILGSTYGSIFIKTANNKIWAAGFGTHGQLGTGVSTATNSTLAEVTYFTTNTIDIVDIQGGYGYFTTSAVTNGATIFLDTNGNVYSTGNNDWGQLGNGTLGGSNTLTPTQVTLTKPVSEIHAFGGGPMTVYCKNTDGTFVRWGYNALGQLGDGTLTSNGTPNQDATAISKIFSTGDAHVYGFYSTVYILYADNTLKAAGQNGAGESGTGIVGNLTSFTDVIFKETSKILDIQGNGYEIGGRYAILLTSDGDVYTCGYGARHGLGITNNAGNQTIFKRIII